MACHKTLVQELVSSWRKCKPNITYLGGPVASVLQ